MSAGRTRTGHETRSCKRNETVVLQSTNASFSAQIVGYKEGFPLGTFGAELVIRSPSGKVLQRTNLLGRGGMNEPDQKHRADHIDTHAAS